MSSKYKCPLCGYNFDEPEEKCHSCPMSKSCNVVCCPNCGYNLVGESRIVEWVKKKFKSGEQKVQGSKEEKS